MSVDLFVGRRDERSRFAALLSELRPGRRRWWWWWRREDPAGATISRVVLVHGLGGSGKSRLLRHFREMADGNHSDSPTSPGQVRTVWLDWEDEQRDQPISYAGVAGPSLVTVLDAVKNAVVGALEPDARAQQEFDLYRRGAARMPEYAARFPEVLAQSRHPGSPFTKEDAGALMRLAASLGLTIIGQPSGVLGLTPEQMAASAPAVGHLSAGAMRAVTGRRAGEVSAEEYDLVTDPERELIRRAAAAIRTVANMVPLAILLDTGEVIGDSAWGWLRRVMAHTGPRVIWVVGARFETEAEADADSPVALFVRHIPKANLRLMSLTRFDDPMIRDYLASRTTGRDYTDAQIDTIAQFTKGLPLAVSLTAGLLAKGQSVDDVCRALDEGRPSSVVSRLARCYLFHAEQRNHPADDPRRDDVKKILGLAIAAGDLRNDLELLAALWDVADPKVALKDLAQRHDFVLAGSCRLHEDVRDTLRTDLLDPFQRSRVRAINQRALDLFKARLGTLRARWPTLDQQLEHTKFTATLRAALGHALWVDNQAGLDLFTEILPVLAVADEATADEAAAVAGALASTFDEDQQREFDLLTEVRPDFDQWVAHRRQTGVSSVHRVKRVLSRVALQPHGVAATYGLVGEPADRRVAVMILRARLQVTDHDDQGAIESLHTAIAQTNSTRLRNAIGNQAQAIANRLIWAGKDGSSVPTATGLAAAKIATDMLADQGLAWHIYAVALDEMGRREQALAAYDRAIALDANNAYVHGNRGNTLLALGRLKEALAAYDRAIALNPDYAYAHRNRGRTMRALGRLDEALAAHDQAIALNPDSAYAHSFGGSTLLALGRLDEALVEHDRAIALDPDNAIVHGNRGNTLLALGRLKEALAAYDRAIALDPSIAVCYENKGILLAEMGDLDGALAVLDTAERLAPDESWEGRTWAGAILWHQGDVEGARDRFARVEGRLIGCTPFHTREMEAIALCGLGHAEEAKQRLLDGLHLRVPGDRAEPRAIYDLLSDPPLAGIERLREIVNGEWD